MGMAVIGTVRWGTALAITGEMCRLLFEGKSPREAMIDLMTRSLKAGF